MSVSPPSLVRKIVAGGQVGVDQSGLCVAIVLGIPHGGWCPLGRRSERGKIPSKFQLTESGSPEYPVRTAQNVIDSDGILILHRGLVEGGTAFTRALAREHGRPFLEVSLGPNDNLEVVAVRDRINQQGIQTLNVAGPRESRFPGIHRHAYRFLLDVFRP